MYHWKSAARARELNMSVLLRSVFEMRSFGESARTRVTLGAADALDTDLFEVELGMEFHFRDTGGTATVSRQIASNHCLGALLNAATVVTSELAGFWIVSGADDVAAIPVHGVYLLGDRPFELDLRAVGAPRLRLPDDVELPPALPAGSALSPSLDLLWRLSRLQIRYGVVVPSPGASS